MLIGAHSTAFVRGQSLEQSIRLSIELDFHAFELFADVQNNKFGTLATGYWAAGHIRSEWEEIAPLLRNQFKVLTVHAPLEGSGVNITASNPGIRANAIEQLQRTIEFAGVIGADVVVIHHGTPAAFVSVEQFFEQSQCALMKLVECAHEHGIKLAVENMHPYFSPEQLMDLIAPFPQEWVGICLDTGHCPLCYVPHELRTPQSANEALENATRTFGTRLFNIHAHDYDGKSDHRGIGRGWFDWNRFIGILHEIGYDGALMLEINEEDDIPALRHSKLRLETVIRNIGCSVTTPCSERI